MTFKTLAKTIVALAISVAALAYAREAYRVYRYSNINQIEVSKLTDLEEVFEVGASSLKVKNPEFLKVCFSADYVEALASAQRWFALNEIEFWPVLHAAGGVADVFNDEGDSSIVLLSHTSAVILQLHQRTGFSVVMVGCASTANDIEIRKSRSDDGIEFYLPNATLRSAGG